VFHTHQFGWEVRKMLGVSTKSATVLMPMDEWLATMAHELRDALATILVALEGTSRDADGDPGARRARTVAEHQARGAMRIAEDVFDLCAGSRDRLPPRS
jgi:signal transduction histidine kinase